MTGDDPEFVVQFDEPPPLPNAPGWAQELARRLYATEKRQQTDRHNANQELQKLSGLFDAMDKKLGEEPDSDGHNGKGLIGDFRKVTMDVRSLMDLRSKGLGFVAAIGLFGAVIILGVIQFVQSVTGHPK